MALVLCTGVHETLVATRKLILEHAGHTVVTALSEGAVIHACRAHAFEVAVIGQAISESAKRGLFETVRQYCPAAKILELYRGTKVLPTADDWLEVPSDVPSDLAHRVRSLVADSEA